MTLKEISIVSWVCLGFAVAFQYFRHPWFSIPFLIGAFVGFLYLVTQGERE